MMLRNAAAVLTLLFAQSALALDGIDLTPDPAAEPAEAAAPDACPAMVKIRYPFLCADGAAPEAGRTLVQAKPVQTNPSWNSARQIPLMSDWTEGDGAWGPDLNQD